MTKSAIRRRTVLGAITALVLAPFDPSISGARAQSIKDSVLNDGKITIGIGNNAPWGFVDKDQKVAGIQPEMIKAVLGPVGVKQVDFVVLDWGALIPSLLSRRIDAIASGMAITPLRCEQVIFSNPDIAIGDGVLVLAGNPHNIHSYADMAKDPARRMGGDRGSTNSENAIKAGIPKDQMLLFQDDQSAYAALMAGRIDAYTMSTVSVIAALKDPNLSGKFERALPFTGFVTNGREAANYAAIEFRPEDAALRDLYDESLAQRKADGTVRKVAKAYGFTDAELAPPDVTAKSLCSANYR
ncbi:ectoine/hydroxyectoine ABC transporter substrate-binding protein EhuB [Mesorhizobium sp. B4-1-4]|uniref:ectoine/hydroxyectoine ABC transporter substrate-binding protein EhuB n=1 Tax=Mesorhizobium sp. B4-1-4 TaxID=2589888 RepID=UPI001126ACD3|nr:ectoine/hydroxyectoine ABC transporter substrate-binding protein EhuB [Mesorhizobium sp. B4-1-4]UCI32008.1 ectoine/hydroxyectoine ABC transporter substrate-binding protein EhuB [Mesorhizobium sp. B4-1-4]